MQVNTRATHDVRIDRMAAISGELDRLQMQIANEKRIGVPSDDPVASGISARLTRLAETGKADLRAIDTAASRLSATDAALGSAGLVMQRAREIALLGANATMSVADRATLAAETAQLGEQLLAIANGNAADGAPLFGGSKGTGAAFVRDATTGLVAWAGSGAPPVMKIGSSTIAAGADARAFTGPGVDSFALLDDLALALMAPPATRAADLLAVQGKIETAGARLADAQAGVGTLAARLEGEGERLRRDGLRLASDQVALDGFDMAGTIARLQRLATVLEATQASFVRLTSLSLWDRL